jgi:hypothetical protein
MSTDQNELKRGLKFVFGAIPLIVFAPILINIGFSAIKKDDNYIFIVIGFIAAIAAIGLVMNGIRVVLKALFN